MWDTGLSPVQWNFVHSAPGVLRGVHVHVKHSDYLVFLSGRVSVGLKDLRPGSPTAGLAALITLGAGELEALVVPPGVAHGFYFHEEATHLYAVNRYFDESDEFGCRFDDPALGIAWPFAQPTLSERDSKASSLAALQKQLSAVFSAAR